MTAIMERNFSLEEKILRGVSFAEFEKRIEEKLSAHPENEKLRLNYQRTKRILTTFQLSEESKNILNKISSDQNWIVITEDWCGDSSQILPVISIIAEASENISLKIVERDTNLDMMNDYLTNGTRSIPLLVAFDKSGEEIFHWGPRPKEGQKIVSDAKAAGIHKDEFMRMLHTWYAKDKGKHIEEEIISILKTKT